LFAYDPSEWTDLFVATAGASAALAGLHFVSVVGLIPGQSAEVLGLELLVGGIFLAFSIVRLPLIREPDGEQPRAWLLSRWAIRVFAVAPLIVGGASLMTSDGGGLYWIVAGVVFAIVGAVANAWVLLVEILR
jgi:modulator of FtsH protease